MMVDRGLSDGGLVGRDGELEACEELFARVGHGGGALLLRGSAGIGKTSLLDAEIPALETVGLAVLGLLAGLATETSPLCVTG